MCLLFYFSLSTIRLYFPNTIHLRWIVRKNIIFYPQNAKIFSLQHTILVCCTFYLHKIPRNVLNPGRWVCYLFMCDFCVFELYFLNEWCAREILHTYLTFVYPPISFFKLYLGGQPISSCSTFRTFFSCLQHFFSLLTQPFSTSKLFFFCFLFDLICFIRIKSNDFILPNKQIKSSF